MWCQLRQKTLEVGKESLNAGNINLVQTCPKFYDIVRCIILYDGYIIIIQFFAGV